MATSWRSASQSLPNDSSWGRDDRDPRDRGMHRTAGALVSGRRDPAKSTDPDHQHRLRRTGEQVEVGCHRRPRAHRYSAGHSRHPLPGIPQPTPVAWVRAKHQLLGKGGPKPPTRKRSSPGSAPNNLMPGCSQCGGTQRRIHDPHRGRRTAARWLSRGQLRLARASACQPTRSRREHVVYRNRESKP